MDSSRRRYGIQLKRFGKMKKTLTYIITILCGFALASCSLDDINPQETGKGRYIEFIARPTSFNVSIGETKALTSDQLTAVEKNIYSLYFIVFDKNGDRIADLSGNLPTTTTSQTLYHDHGGEITVCYLANVSKEYANSLQTLEDLSTKPITIEYDTYAKTGYLGIPLIDVSTTGTPDKKNCIPMFGSYTLSITDGAITGATTSNNVTQVTIPLERLFAKVTVKVKSEMDDDDWGINFNPPSIDISKYMLINLPKKVFPAAALGAGDVILKESSWAIGDYKTETIELEEPLSISDGSISLGDLWESNGDYAEIVTCYIPEYAVAPTGTNLDQTQKPNFVASTKYPVHFTLTGIAKQDKFVDVPVEYHIYFGEDAFDNFNLRRNTWYNTNLLIKGTSDAVIGEDSRVEATYHNLADPNRTGIHNPANCYIISKPGRYLLPTYKGNDVNGGTFDGTVDANSVISLNGSTNNRIDNIEFKTIGGKHYIQFDVNMYDTDGTTVKLTDVAAGNKLLTLKQNGNIIWSWHLWFCEDSHRPEQFHNTYVNGSNTYTVLNRAIGATTNTGIEIDRVSLTTWSGGLYYQWGRKDPMLESGNTVVEEGGTYANSEKNPRTFYSDWVSIDNAWIDEDNSKTIYDPCPPGYRVPNNSIWKDKYSPGTLENAGNLLGVFSYNLGATIDVTTAIVYPYSSYLTSKGALKGIYTDYLPFREGHSFTSLGRDGTLATKLLLSTYNLPRLAEDKFTLDNMKIQVSLKEGRLWGLDSDNSSYLSYINQSLDVSNITSWEALSDIVQVGEFKQERRLVEEYKVELSWSKIQELIKLISSGNITDAMLSGFVSKWGPYQEVRSPQMSDADKVSLYTSLLGELNNINNYDHSKVTASINPAEGCQIRCVKE